MIDPGEFDAPDRLPLYDGPGGPSRGWLYIAVPLAVGCTQGPVLAPFLLGLAVGGALVSGLCYLLDSKPERLEQRDRRSFLAGGRQTDPVVEGLRCAVWLLRRCHCAPPGGEDAEDTEAWMCVNRGVAAAKERSDGNP